MEGSLIFFRTYPLGLYRTICLNGHRLPQSIFTLVRQNIRGSAAPIFLFTIKHQYLELPAITWLLKLILETLLPSKRFPIFKTDSVYSLTERCYSYILTLFYEIISGLLEDKPLPKSEETWQRDPYKRKELNELCEISPDMLTEEVKKRIQATSFPGMPGAYVKIGGYKFMLEGENNSEPKQI